MADSDRSQVFGTRLSPGVLNAVQDEIRSALAEFDTNRGCALPPGSRIPTLSEDELIRMVPPKRRSSWMSADRLSSNRPGMRESISAEANPKKPSRSVVARLVRRLFLPWASPR